MPAFFRWHDSRNSATPEFHDHVRLCTRARPSFPAPLESSQPNAPDRTTYAAAPAAGTLPPACTGLTFLPSLLYRTLGGGARLRRPSRERTLRCVSLVQSHSGCLLRWRRTGQSCRGWRRRRSTGASSTSLGRSTRRRRRRQRYHL